MDLMLDIATGKSRKEMHWKNQEISWGDLVQKLSVTHRTHETLAEYSKSSVTRQAEIKDIGGFVGGYVTGGRRKAGNILHRSLITLDLDFAKMDFWELFEMQFDFAACIYSTHKHSTSTPRFRLVIPLDRPVFVDEYMAISRRIAGYLGINYFDDTTFEASRLMYWPSTSIDGDYFFEEQKGEPLCADTVLNSYVDWKDSSAWAYSNRVGDAIHRDIKKQGDPLEKSGAIGAFCREYTISEAIDEFLSDSYSVCEGGEDNRYSYALGSSAGGLVTYEDKFSFSHHGTDPTSGKLCNAFDLVRIHLFGTKDENAKEGTPINKMPSFTAMEDLISKDKRVRQRIAVERLESAKIDFGSNVAETILGDVEVEGKEAEEQDLSWLGELTTNKQGETLPTIENALIALRNDPNLKGLFSLDLFDLREQATRNLPWRDITLNTRFLKDVDDSGLRHYFQKVYNLKGKNDLIDAMNLIVAENAVHPIKDYLGGLEWDGFSRLDTLFIDYLGAEDNEYNRAITRKTLVAAVKRIYEPGSKFDYVLTLIGSQGVGKSTIISKLGQKWYSDSFGNIQSKEAYESIQGVWLMEMGELAGLKKSDVETVKHFISKAEDRYRVAYGRRVDNYPRQCIFIGTTNNREFLTDPTGNRRFWIVDTNGKKVSKSIWEDLTKEEVSQIWAEALHFYRKGETTFLSKELEAVAKEVQTIHAEIDDREELISAYLDTLLPVDWAKLDIYQKREYLKDKEKVAKEGLNIRRIVTVITIWEECFNRNATDIDKYQSNLIRNLIKKIGTFEAGIRRIDGKLVRCFYRI